MDTRDRQIANLTETVAQLRDELRRLRGYDDEVFFVKELRVSKHCVTVLRLFLSRRLVTRELMMDAMYGDRASGGPETAPKVIDTVMHRLRRKLKPFGVSVRTVHGIGYEIDQHGLSVLRSLVLSNTSLTEPDLIPQLVHWSDVKRSGEKRV